MTRDPALTACSALSLQVESRGRAVLGIGRGDSSVQRASARRRIPSSSEVGRDVAAASFVALGRELLPALSRGG